jgi:hypothetical protein
LAWHVITQKQKHMPLQHLLPLQKNTQGPKVRRAPVLVLISTDSPPENDILNTSPLDLIVQDGWTPLYWAARNGQRKVVALLLSAGAAVDAATIVSPPISPPCQVPDISYASPHCLSHHPPCDACTLGLTTPQQHTPSPLCGVRYDITSLHDSIGGRQGTCQWPALLLWLGAAATAAADT